MRVMVIDTALGLCTAGIFEVDGRTTPLGVRSVEMAKGHQERLGGLAREAMDKANPSVLWQFTPAIAQHDLEYYGGHWPHNSAIGMGYSTALGGFTAGLGTPPPLAPEAASPAAPAAAFSLQSPSVASVRPAFVRTARRRPGLARAPPP